MNEFDHHSFLSLSSSEKGLNEDSNPDLCDSGAMFHQLSYQANWELAVKWVDHKPVDVEIDGDDTGIFPCI